MENKTFKDLNLREPILKAIEELGYTTPSQIQAQAIPVAIEGYDLIGQAQTGTGKTAAFGCSMLNNLKKTDAIGAIVLTPTRELAIQVYEELNKLSKYDKVNVLAVYGGDSISRQIRELKKHVDIVVGTPGRVLDLIRRGVLKLGKVQFLVLDEADEMLNMGFIDDIETVIKELPTERQTLLFSATMPDQIKRLAKHYMKKDSKIINVKKVSMTVSKIKQGYFEVDHKNKFEAFCRIIDLESPKSAIIFCKTKKGVDDLVEGLKSRDYQVEGMHGDMSQMHRMKTLKRFKEGSLHYLIATDVAARGIDVDGITHVINYDLPQDVESYVHRIGRTGRANREGTAYSLITSREFSMLKQIKNVTKGQIDKIAIPTVNQILNAKYNAKADEIKEVLNEGNYDKYMDLANELCNKYNPTDVVAAIMKMQFDNQLSFKYEKDVLETPKRDFETRKSSSKNDNEVRLFFSIGKRDNLTVKALVRYVAETAGISGKQINKVDIMDSFSFISVDKAVYQKVINKCSGQKLNKRKINVEVSTKRKR